jgi:putative tricarboxylic transport membrane protein
MSGAPGAVRPVDGRAVLGPRAVGVVLLVAGLFLGWVAVRAAAEDGVRIDGPRLVPLVVTGAWVVLAAVYLVSQFIHRAPTVAGPAVEEPAVDEPEPAQAPSATHKWTPVLLGAALIGYLLLLEPLGFALASAAFFSVAARILGSRRPVRDALVGIPLGVGVYLAFTALLDVRLPAGVLPW